MNDDIIVIYHGNCADGFTAAWLVNLFHSHAAGFAVVEWPGVDA